MLLLLKEKGIKAGWVGLRGGCWGSALKIRALECVFHELCSSSVFSDRELKFSVE